jgi:hypothetical protein
VAAAVERPPVADPLAHYWLVLYWMVRWSKTSLEVQHSADYRVRLPVPGSALALEAEPLTARPEYPAMTAA